MKLLFSLDEKNLVVFNNEKKVNEHVLYCIPFDFHEEKRVKGFMVFTETHIYKLLDGVILEKHLFSDLSDFSTEVMLGICGFFAKEKGNSILLCNFISGRNLARYSVMVTACERLASNDFTIITSNEPESYCPKCGRPFIKKTTICPYCRSKKEIYKKLFDMTKGVRLMMCFPLIATTFAIIANFAIPFFQKEAINCYITNNNLEGNYMAGFLLIVFAIVTLDLINRTLGVVNSRLSAIAGNKFTSMMRKILFEKLQTLSMSSLSKKSPGDLMGRINGDVSAIQQFITNQLPSYFSMFMSLIVAVILLLLIEPTMCLFVFIPLPIIAYVIISLRGTLRRRLRKNRRLRHKYDKHLQDILGGMRVVKAYGNEEHEIKEFHKKNSQFFKNELEAFTFFDTLFPIINFTMKIGGFLIIGVGNYRLFNGTLDIGTLNQFSSYTNIVYEPLMQISQLPRALSTFITSLSKILEILEEEPEIYDAKKAKLQKINGDVSFDDVYFGYDSYNPVLKGINFNVKKGEMIGIVGHSGCGKTTLVNLIMRLYDPTEGRITIDGTDLRELSQDNLRSQIGVVLQETHLFSGSVYENIRYAKPYATEKEVINVARCANAHDFIMNLPEGYNTIIGEKGFSLSGGERQRIAIARALIHDPSILILDEATAALDTETEKTIQDAINKVAAGRTTFVIAHRLSTLRNADKILVLNHGRLCEYGTHTELLEKKGIYYSLVMAQANAALGDALKR